MALRFLVLFCLALFLAPPPSFALETRSGERVEWTGDLTQLAFGAGERLNAKLKSNNDLFLAAGDLAFTGQTSQALYLAAGDLVVENGTARNAVVAGGDVRLSKSSFSDLLAAGGKLKLESLQVQDDLIAAGGEIQLDGQMRGDVLLAGGKVSISGRFEKAVQIYAGEIVIQPGTEILGSLTYSAKEVDIDSNAKIHGTVTVIPIDMEKHEKREKGKGVLAVGAFLALLGLVLLPLIVVVTLPKQAQTFSEVLTQNLWESLGKGVALALALPPTLIILMITGIGLPLAFALVPFVAAFKIVVISFGIFTLGDLILRKLKVNLSGSVRTKVAKSAALGAFLAGIVMVIPPFGILVWIFGILSSIGAGVTRLLSARS